MHMSQTHCQLIYRPTKLSILYLTSFEQQLCLWELLRHLNEAVHEGGLAHRDDQKMLFKV